METTNIVFEFCEGLRKGSRLLYLSNEKQIFKKKSTYRRKVTYTCYISGCEARVTLEGDVCKKILGVEHNHEGDQENDFQKLKLLNNIKRDTETLSKTEYHSVSSARKAYNANILR